MKLEYLKNYFPIDSNVKYANNVLKSIASLTKYHSSCRVSYNMDVDMVPSYRSGAVSFDFAFTQSRIKVHFVATFLNNFLIVFVSVV